MVLRFLIGAACIAVIAATGGFFLDRQQAKVTADDQRRALLDQRLNDECSNALLQVREGGDFLEARAQLDLCEASGWKAP
ncbi:hypothetical protein [Mangrovibrevibacter kandeliae]|uniref:hypothetical protein n=1 Tax=Mangrovibrevibacter kandeliae TaxID=2968473 RepID=UPI002118B7C6|nr:hypothetical protein [Aurantimonas sp. CSK15Z-1]MCQ8781724.1 hypothetical protein [Aurantimonas sp. CSK15Z-1]